MLYSKRIFRVATSPGEHCRENLKRHVDTRLAIVQKATNARFAFGNEPNCPSGWGPPSGRYVNALASGWSANEAISEWWRGQDLIIGCQGGLHLVMLAGMYAAFPSGDLTSVNSLNAYLIASDLVTEYPYRVGNRPLVRAQIAAERGIGVFERGETEAWDWVPGDAGYIINRAYNLEADAAGHDGAAVGATSGQNILYLGQLKFWGTVRKNPIRTLSEWYEHVVSFNNTGNPDLSRVRVWPRIGLRGYLT